MQDILAHIDKPVKAAALLHDVGHGPFSHVFERISEQKHEIWTEKIILDKDSRVYTVLVGADIDPRDVAGIINKTYTPSLAVDIISSELDADRMDYLLRDSHMCGVTYGQFDLEWMLHIMHAACVSIDAQTKLMKLCADASKGIRAIEQYVLARIQMYEQVYFHKTTRAIEGLLGCILGCARELMLKDNWDPPGADTITRKLLEGRDLELLEYQLLDEYCLVTAIASWAHMECKNEKEQELRMLSNNLLHRGKPFGYVDLTGRLINAGKVIQELNMNRPDLRFQWFVDNPESTVYKGILYSLERKESLEEQVNSTIYVLKRGEPSPVEFDSAILKGLSGEKFKRHRLYYNRSKEEEFKQLFSKFELN